nr:putative f-box protein [Quercus suber]
MSKWADLPHFMLYEIICRLSFFDDIFIVGAVCKSWKSVVNSFEKPPLPPKGPWIMLSEEREQGNKESKTRSLFNLLDTKTYDFKLPELVGRKCLGTSFGWLLTIGSDLQINLFHPLSKHLISLPPQSTFGRQYTPEVEPEHLRNMFVPKCVLSRSPWNSVTNECDRDCIIMTIYGEIRTLAFTRPGYKAWIDIESPSRAYDDIAFYKGNFYAVDAHGEVFACRIDDNQKVVAKAVAPRPEGTEDLIKKYIVESAGDLLLVLRVRGDDNIELYEETLNGGGYDMGVFSMKDGTFDKHYPESFSYYSTPLWFI